MSLALPMCSLLACLQGWVGTYNQNTLRTSEGLDLPRLVSNLVDLRADSFEWLIVRQRDWDELPTFLPWAQAFNIKACVCVLPPVEGKSEPFGSDFGAWAEALGKLSLKYPVLEAWTIDDMSHYWGTDFTPEKVRTFAERGRAVNPKLKFGPTAYWPELFQSVAERYRGLFDFIIFPYRSESSVAGLADPSKVEYEVATIRLRFGIPVILMIYGAPHSTLGSPTPRYVDDCLIRGYRCADGVVVYGHPWYTDMYEVVRRHYGDWSRRPWPVAALALPATSAPLTTRPALRSWADADGDGDVDLADFLAFQKVFNGPNHPPNGCPCWADHDGDVDVDVADLLAFQAVLNGPNRPPRD